MSPGKLSSPVPIFLVVLALSRDSRKESMEYIMINVFGLRWNCRELKGIVKLGFSGPKIIDIVKHKLSYLPLGREGKTFRKTFSTTDSEKLLNASRCYLYTTAGPIAGILFVSTERVGFCSDRSLKIYSTTGELLKFQYKVSIPLSKIKGVEESMNMKKPSKKYVELVTDDSFNFWFLGFSSHKKTLRYLRQTISTECFRF
nr:hypothetical protein [Tanacetum cinerariifolium]